MIDLKLAAELAATAGTVTSLWLAGRKSLWGPVVGIANFLPWTTFAVATESYVLIALNLVIAALHVRCLVLWRRA